MQFGTSLSLVSLVIGKKRECSECILDIGPVWEGEKSFRTSLNVLRKTKMKGELNIPKISKKLI
jgi:hypothetical protein